MKEDLTYQQAQEELQSILQDLREGATTVDELDQKVERASLLIKFCSSKLRNTEARLSQLLGQDSEQEPE